MWKFISLTVLLMIICLAGVGCETNPLANMPISNQTSQQMNKLQQASWVHVSEAPPAELVSIDAFGQSLNFWPYSGENFSGTPQDPINLIFVGNADPREIRAALLNLDGDRTAFGLPAEAPFNAIWDDAIGDVQTGYGVNEGWTGGVVQLACGDYGPVRFHMRMFRLGDYTVANAHFEVLIPGTTDHQVLSWELAEQLVTVDLIRTGLLGAEPASSDPINTPNFRTIPAMIYNLLPMELRGAIGGPLGDVGEDVPIGSDGNATVFNLIGSTTVTEGTRVQDFIVTFDQTIPKPFCAASEYDYLYVYGDVHLYQTVEVNDAGTYRMKFQAEGILSATPVNPLTGEVIGETLEAVVKESHDSYLNDIDFSATSSLFQKLLPTSDPNAGWLFKRLKVDSKANNGFEEKTKCSDSQDFYISN